MEIINTNVLKNFIKKNIDVNVKDYTAEIDNLWKQIVSLKDEIIILKKKLGDGDES